MPNGAEVGDKKHYPSLRAQLKYILDAIAPLLEDSSHFSSLPAVGATLTALIMPPPCHGACQPQRSVSRLWGLDILGNEFKYQSPEVLQFWRVSSKSLGRDEFILECI